MKQTLKMMLFLLCSFLASLAAETITVDKIPANESEFLALRDSLAKTPEGGAVVFAVAMMKYAEDEKLGMVFFTIALTSDNLSKGSAYKGFSPASSFNFHFKRLLERKYLPKAYAEGCQPGDGYACQAPYKFTVSRNKYSGEEKSGRVKVFINTYGVSPRPVSMMVNDKGLWKVKEVSSLFVDVQPPKKNASDDL